MDKMSIRKRSNLVIALTILVAILFSTPIVKLIQPVGFLFNVVFAGLIGLIFFKEQFLQQFKHFKLEGNVVWHSLNDAYRDRYGVYLSNTCGSANYQQYRLDNFHGNDFYSNSLYVDGRRSSFH